MIHLYPTFNTGANGWGVIFARPVSMKRITLWGATRVKFYDYTTVALAQAAIAAGTAVQVAELRGSVNAPKDELICKSNEVLTCVRGLVFFADASADPTAVSIRVYTMGNPVGSQGT